MFKELHIHYSLILLATHYSLSHALTASWDLLLRGNPDIHLLYCVTHALQGLDLNVLIEILLRLDCI